MKFVLKTISYLALALIIIPPVLYLGDSLSKPAMFNLMLAGTIAWFITVPFWMGKKA